MSLVQGSGAVSQLFHGEFKSGLLHEVLALTVTRWLQQNSILCIGKAKYFGDGMKITPTADPFSGDLEVFKHSELVSQFLSKCNTCSNFYGFLLKLYRCM